MDLTNGKKEPKEEDKANKPAILSQEWLEEFFIPRNFIDVVFILICFILMWYALTYDIASAKVPIICADYWNKWAAEKASLLGGLNVSADIMGNATPVYNPITIPVTLPNLTSTAAK
jgi:hypothetical protein